MTHGRAAAVCFQPREDLSWFPAFAGMSGGQKEGTTNFTNHTNPGSAGRCVWTSVQRAAGALESGRNGGPVRVVGVVRG